MRATGLRRWLGRTRDRATRELDRNSKPRVATGMGLGLGDQGRNKGFFVMTGPFGH